MQLKFNIKPATVKMYTTLDKNMGTYGLPFSCTNDREAERALAYYCMMDPEGKVKGKDLEVYSCGTFNKDTGIYQNSTLKLVARGTKYVQNSIQRKSENEPTKGQ